MGELRQHQNRDNTSLHRGIFQMKYYQQWITLRDATILRGISCHHTGRAHPAICAHWEHVYRSRILTRLSKEISVLLDIDNVFARSSESDEHGDACCLAELGYWKQATVKISTSIVPFSVIADVRDV